MPSVGLWFVIVSLEYNAKFLKFSGNCGYSTQSEDRLSPCNWLYLDHRENFKVKSALCKKEFRKKIYIKGSAAGESIFYLI